MSEAIQVQHLAYEYPSPEDSQPIRVFEDLNLTVEEGTFLAVLGRNGCGKSTLAKHFNAICLPCGGSVHVFGMDTKDEESLIPIRRTVGMVFQNPDNQIVANVVEEDVAFAPENLGVPTEEIRLRVDNALESVGMYDYRKHAPHLLSGGQKQRVAIAGVIAMRPRCIVLDEPTAMLDPRGRQEVMDIVQHLNKTSGITVVLITHHMEEAALADRVVILDKGTVAADGTPKAVFSRVELLHRLGLAAPETVELCWALGEEGRALPLDALSIEECAQAIYRWAGM
ncbi:MAG: energy-coupling factor transporter ATPase [Faecousia sp.]